MERVNESSCIPKRYKVYYDRKEEVIMRKIILASASPRRKELLERAGVDFEVLLDVSLPDGNGFSVCAEIKREYEIPVIFLPASGDENRISDNPGEAVKQLASDKAASVIRTMKDSADGTIVIGSDTVVVFENVILGKPHDTEDAVNTLKKLQANTHQVYTGVSVWEKKEKVWTEHTFYESTDVTFYPVSDEEIREYVATGEPMDKAGSYGIQGLFGIYVKGINGDYNNVVGLPVARLFYEMKKSGINLRG